MRRGLIESAISKSGGSLFVDGNYKIVSTMRRSRLVFNRIGLLGLLSARVSRLRHYGR